MPKFSIIIPTKDRNLLFENALWSVLRQSHRDFEVIIVDNGDAPIPALRANELQHQKHVTYVRTGRLKMPHNWKRGLECSNGEYIIYLTDRCVFSTAGMLSFLEEKINNRFIKIHKIFN